MKEKALLTCQGMLPDNVAEIISQQLDLSSDICALGESNFKKIIDGVKIHFMGGEEFYSPEVAEAARDLERIYFIGMMPLTYIHPSALEIFNRRGVKIIPTGGGQAAVVQSTIDLLYDDFIMTPIFSRDFKWVAGEPGGLKSLLRQLSLVVIGAGKIGMDIINKMNLDFSSVCYGGGRSEKEGLKKLGVPWESDLRKAFSRGRVISINLAYSPETEGIIRYEHLFEIPKNSLLINAARAALIEPYALCNFIKERPDVEVILDVHYVEGKDFEKLQATNIGLARVYRDIIKCPNVRFLQHRFATRHPELSVPEYGENLLRLLYADGTLSKT
jgi:hypothetical protein